MYPAIVVIGNGPSRLSIDLTKIEAYTIGCNALYRDFTPDLLIAADIPIQKEIIAAGYQGACLFRKHEGVEYPSHYQLFNDKPKSSGLYGVRHALTLSNRIYCIGFDFEKDGNVYFNTNGYGTRHGSAVREGERYLAKLAKTRKITWVNDKASRSLKKSTISIAQFKGLFKC